MGQGTFRLGIVVLAHSEPEQLAKLMTALNHPQVSVYLHIDSKPSIEPFHAAFKQAGVEDVTWLKRRRTMWGTTDTVDAELDGISQAVAGGCDYVVLISGSDFPLRPIGDIVRFFADSGDRTYLEARALPNSDEAPGEFEGRSRIEFYSYRLPGAVLTCVPYGEDTSGLSRKMRAANLVLRLWTMFRPARKFPSYAAPFKGSHWFNLSRSAATYLLEFLRDHPDYRRYHDDTVCGDEIFVHSVLRGTSFADQHEIVNDDLRYVVWGEAAGPHPRVLTPKDLPDMLSSGDLFARKVSSREQPELFAELLELINSDEQNGSELAS